MVTITHFFILITQIMFVISEPIDEGGDVGRINIHANGEKTVVNPGKFPYIVNLDIQSVEIEEKPKITVFEVHSLCGGSLIRNNIVLSAAHCVKKDGIEKITAWLGVVETELEEGKGQKIPVKGFTIHENYIPKKGYIRFKNDIAILFLLKPAVFNDYVKLASLAPRDFVAADKRGWIIGWGTLSCGTQKSMLQQAVTRGVSATDCYERYYKPLLIPESVICILSDDRKKTSTHGDSGGPFIIEGYVVGVSSFGTTDLEKSDEKRGIQACDPTVPAAYTYVPKYLDWIEDTISAGPRTVIIRAPFLPPRGDSVQPPKVPPRIRERNKGGRPPQRTPTQLSSSTKNKKRDPSKRRKAAA